MDLQHIFNTTCNQVKHDDDLRNAFIQENQALVAAKMNELERSLQFLVDNGIISFCGHPSYSDLCIRIIGHEQWKISFSFVRKIVYGREIFVGMPSLHELNVHTNYSLCCGGKRYTCSIEELVRDIAKMVTKD